MSRRALVFSLSLLPVLAACSAGLGHSGGSMRKWQCEDRGDPVRYDAEAAAARQRLTFPSGVVSPAGDVAYVHTPGYQVAALDLATGKARWQVPMLGELLFATPRAVAVWTRGADRRLAVASAADGSVMLTSGPLPLPSWAASSGSDEPNDYVTAWGEGTDAVVRWTGLAAWRGGHPPSPAEEKAASHEDCGSLRIDLTTGAVVAGGEIPEPERPSVEPARPPGVHKEDRPLGEDLWLCGHGPEGRAIVTAGGARLAVDAVAEGQIEEASVVGGGVYASLASETSEPPGASRPRVLIAFDGKTGAFRWRFDLEPIRPRSLRP